MVKHTKSSSILANVLIGFNFTSAPVNRTVIIGISMSPLDLKQGLRTPFGSLTRLA